MTGPAAPAARRGFGRGDAYALLVTLVWGINFPVSKPVLDVLDPLIYSSTRYFAGALLLFAILRARDADLDLPVRDILPLIGLGLLGITLFQGFWAYGLKYTTASKAAILVSSTPIFGAAVAGIMGQWPTRNAWIGIVLSFAGIVVLINNSVTDFSALAVTGGSLKGDLSMLAATLFWSLYTALAVDLVRRHGPLKVTAYSMLFGSVILGVVSLPALVEQSWAGMTPALWSAWGFSTVFSAALGFVWWYTVLDALGITKAMAYAFFVPVVALIVAFLFLGETLSPLQLTAAVVVLAGVRLTRGS